MDCRFEEVGCRLSEVCFLKPEVNFRFLSLFR